GGGTPSLLRPESVAELVDGATSAFRALPELEVTLELNPGTTLRERLPGFREAGINRLSVGVQSFDDGKLKRLGRAHLADECRKTLEAARAARFDNVSLDLLFRAPGESMAQLERDLGAFVAAEPEHVSTYELTLEAGTPMKEAAARGRLPRAGEDEAAEMMTRLDEGLGAAGLVRYELASYSRPGFESSHNRRYWERAAVLGLGLGAWSSTPVGEGSPFGGRRSNLRSLDRYLGRLESGTLPDLDLEVHDSPTARAEAMLLGLRRTQGVDAQLFAAEFGGSPDDFYPEPVADLVRTGLLVRGEGGNLLLTRRGRLLADTVAERFV
ncbi:MAG: coproporphyrinogen-III oxidase family protein, partial [Acidobacteria bacterium]|nr:coproporphyrinogen-III oxidase family protein [Acidobacteriota bacterium]